MFGFIRRNKSQKIEDSYEYSPAVLTLLSKFRKGSTIDKFRNDDNWKSVLHQDPVKVYNGLISDGLIEQAGLIEKMDIKLSIASLKEILKKNSLKISGNKNQLIQRLIDFDRTAMQNVTKDINPYKCTAKGLQIVEEFLEKEKEKRIVLEKELKKFIIEKKFEDAIRKLSQFESKQVFPRGMGIDWSNRELIIDVFLEILQYIFNRKPAILNQIDTSKLEVLRIAAAITELLGDNRPIRWVPENFETGINLNVEVSCRMLIFHANYLKTINQYKNNGVKTVEISPSEDNSTCTECKKLSGKRFNINTVPELPYVKCRCEIGCRCIVLATSFKNN